MWVGIGLTLIYIISFTPLNFLWLLLGPLFFPPPVKRHLNDMTWQVLITPNAGKVMETLFVHLHADTGAITCISYQRAFESSAGSKRGGNLITL